MLPVGAGVKEYSRRNRSIAGVLTKLKDSTEAVDVFFNRCCRRLDDRWTEIETNSHSKLGFSYLARLNNKTAVLSGILKYLLAKATQNSIIGKYLKYVTKFGKVF